MKNLFKYAAEHWKTLIAIIIVLFIQAYCDLSLPAYTSDIVNVGLTTGRVSNTLMQKQMKKFHNQKLHHSEVDPSKLLL